MKVQADNIYELLALVILFPIALLQAVLFVIVGVAGIILIAVVAFVMAVIPDNPSNPVSYWRLFTVVVAGLLITMLV